MTVYDEAIPQAAAENKPVGRLVRVSNPGGTTLYRWDGLGRPLASQQTPAGGTAYISHYTNRPAGMASMTYPSGRRVDWTHDEAGRHSSVTGWKDTTSTPYITGITYAPHGAVSSMSIANGARTERWCYNNRMQPVGIRLGTSSAATCDAQAGDLLRLTFGYGLATKNNGNIHS